MKRSVRSVILERFGVEPARPRLALVSLPHPRAVRAPEKLYARRKPPRGGHLAGWVGFAMGCFGAGRCIFRLIASVKMRHTDFASLITGNSIRGKGAA